MSDKKSHLNGIEKAAIFISVFAVLCALSWAICCGVMWLICCCFSWTFRLSIATGVWLILWFVQAMFPGKRK